MNFEFHHHRFMISRGREGGRGTSPLISEEGAGPSLAMSHAHVVLVKHCREYADRCCVSVADKLRPCIEDGSVPDLGKEVCIVWFPELGRSKSRGNVTGLLLVASTDDSAALIRFIDSSKATANELRIECERLHQLAKVGGGNFIAAADAKRRFHKLLLGIKELLGGCDATAQMSATGEGEKGNPEVLMTVPFLAALSAILNVSSAARIIDQPDIWHMVQSPKRLP